MSSSLADPRSAARAYAAAAGVWAAACGLLVLYGWIIHSPILIGFGPGRTPMAPNSAACFVLVGTALLLSLRPGTARRRLFRLGVAAVVAAEGAVTLAEYFFEVSVGIDTILIRAADVRAERPSPYAAVAFLFLAAAFATLRLAPRRTLRPSDVFGLACCGIGLLGVSGYAFGVEHFLTLSWLRHAVSMSLPTALTLTFCGAGLLAAQPDRGLAAVVASPYQGGQVARRLLAAVLVLEPILAALAIFGQRAGAYPEPGAAVLTMATALAVVLAGILWTAHAANGLDQERIAADARVQAFLKAQEKRRFDAALEAAASAMVLLDPAGRIAYANAQAERLFDRSQDELTGRALDSIVSEGGEGVRKDGSRFPVEVSRTEIELDEGRFVVVAVLDVSVRRSAELALRRSVEELEDFAYTVSHNLRSPLRAVEGYASLARQRLSGRADQECVAYLAKISESSARLDRLIRDLLSYAAVTRAQPVLEPVDLDRLLDQVLEHHPEAAGAAVRRPLGRVLGQRSLLIQAVSNLLANAVKFVPAGRAPRVEVWSDRPGPGRVRLNVADNGVGISERLRERIFQAFERGAEMGTPGATGIGLAIVKKAAERMGGTVGVESREGEGSRFWIELSGA